MTLRPRNIIQAAEADLARRQRNMARYRGELSSPPEIYAFYAAHVRKAMDAEHLIALALKNPSKGLESSKGNTRLIYSDEALLRTAIDALQFRDAIVDLGMTKA